jgi:hypothetical protein
MIRWPILQAPGLRGRPVSAAALSLSLVAGLLGTAAAWSQDAPGPVGQPAPPSTYDSLRTPPEPETDSVPATPAPSRPASPVDSTFLVLVPRPVAEIDADLAESHGARDAAAKDAEQANLEFQQGLAQVSLKTKELDAVRGRLLQAKKAKKSPEVGRLEGQRNLVQAELGALESRHRVHQLDIEVAQAALAAAQARSVALGLEKELAGYSPPPPDRPTGLKQRAAIRALERRALEARIESALRHQELSQRETDAARGRRDVFVALARLAALLPLQ